MSEESNGSAAASDSAPNVMPGIRDWLVLFVAFMALNVVILAYKTLTAFVALSWIGILYGVNVVILVIGLVLVYARDSVAPRFWRAVLTITAAFNVLLAAVHLMDWSS